MIEEVSRRKEGFRDSARVALADGREWALPEPRLVMYPRFDAGKAALGISTDLGPEFDALVEASQATAGLDYAAQVRAVFDVFAALLRFNYELSDGELSGLLRFPVGEESTDDVLRTVARVASGSSEKKGPPPAG